MIEIGDKHFKNKEYLRAFDWYAETIALDDSSWLNRFKAKRRIKRIDKMMNLVIKKRDDYEIEVFHYAQGYNFYRTDKLDNAVEEWEKVFTLNPKKSELKEYISLYAGSKKEEIEKRREDIAESKAMVNKGLDVLSKNNYKEAVSLFESALKVDPENTLAQKYLEETNLKLEQEQTAKAEAKRKALLIEAKQKRLQREEAQKKKPEKKAPVVKLSQQEKEKLVQSLYNKALRAYALGKLEEAMNLWREILKYDPKNEKVLKNMERTEKELESK
ncbi:tetratricopeptide repeat protein [bacterium]